MKKTSVRDFRANLAELIDGTEPIVVTRHGEETAVVYPLRNPATVPLEVRRRVAESAARRLGIEESAALDAVIERYKEHVDRTLIRENLRQSAEQRLRNLQELQRFAAEVRRAGARRK